ncbi:hypothetical protein D068_cds20730 [Bacillus atrophaeus UCMB-5137]|nr:hypothetical protein D068_cds20730 [Bacillus atrophaeus UCMB-5137]
MYFLLKQKNMYKPYFPIFQAYACWNWHNNVAEVSWGQSLHLS